MSSRVAITIHGIRTRGEWQKTLAPILARNNIVPFPLDYGRFSALKFLSRSCRERRLEWFRKQYYDICKSERVTRPSIIAHSFGSYLTAELLKFPEIKFDKVILAGAIVSENFDWQSKIDNGQVLCIRNEVATQDIWPGIAKKVVSGAGTSGSKGFTKQCSMLDQFTSDVGHSGTFFESRFESWAKIINSHVLAPDDAKQLRGALEMCVLRTSACFQFPAKNVRANIFLPQNNLLKLLRGATVNMDGHPDSCLEIPIGLGATGHVFSNLKERDPYVAVFNGTWGGDVLPSEQMKKVHPDLKWIMSFPLTDPDDGRLIGAMSIDGLHNVLNSTILNMAASQQLLADLEFLADGVAAKLCTLEQGKL